MRVFVLLTIAGCFHEQEQPIAGPDLDGMRLGTGQPPVADLALAGCVATEDIEHVNGLTVWTWDASGHRVLYETGVDESGGAEERYTSQFDGDLLVRVTGQERGEDPSFLYDETFAYDAHAHLATWSVQANDIDGDFGWSMDDDQIYVWDQDRVSVRVGQGWSMEYAWDPSWLEATEEITIDGPPGYVSTRVESWDEDGLLRWTTSQDDPGDYTVLTTWEYDALGRVVGSVTDNDEDGENEFITRWTWACP